MKNIFSMLNFAKLFSEVKQVFLRFPVAVFAILLVSWIFFSLIHWDFTNLQEQNMIRGVTSGITLFFFSIWLYIFWESRNFSPLKKQLYQLIAIIYSSLYFVFFHTTWINDIEEIIFFNLSLAGIIGFLFFAPYVENIIKKNWKQSVYYTYFYNISVIFLLWFILGWVLFALWAIWITAVETLFDIWGYLNTEAYWDWAVLSLCIFTPMFALSLIPNKQSFSNNYFNENSFFSFLIKYIAIPFIYIYFIILYVYSAKVLINFWDWPKWEVSWMVILFSIFGYIAYVFSYIFEEKTKYIKIFRKFFPWAVIPQIFMLFYAIYLRISQYDITVNRYFVIVFWIWLLSISIYYAMSRKKYLGNLFTSLTIFTILISIGPWSVYSLPESRQLERLKNNLIQANILQENGSITPLNSETSISSDLSKNIYSWIDYLCDFNNCDSIKELFPDIYDEILEEFNEKQRINKINNPDYTYYLDEPRSWEIIEKVTKKIKVYNYNSNISFDQKSSYYISNHSDIFPIDTTNIKTIYKIENYAQDNNPITILSNNDSVITINKNWEFFTQVDYKKINDQILDIIQEKQTTNLSKEDLSFDFEHDWKNFTLIFNSIYIKNTDVNYDENTRIYTSLSWYLLEK